MKVLFDHHLALALPTAAFNSNSSKPNWPWAHSTFGGAASYCPVAGPAQTAEFLRDFYDVAPSLNPPPQPASWAEVARQFKAVYERVLNAPA